MAWLRAEMDDPDKFLVSMLWCIVCQQYETRIRRLKTSPGHGSMGLATIK